MRRCRRYLLEKSPQAAARAAAVIDKALSLLEITPEMGRPFADTADLRELPIRFGDSGYLALYRYRPGDAAVYIVAFKHQREAKYYSSSA